MDASKKEKVPQLGAYADSRKNKRRRSDSSHTKHAVESKEGNIDEELLLDDEGWPFLCGVDSIILQICSVLFLNLHIVRRERPHSALRSCCEWPGRYRWIYVGLWWRETGFRKSRLRRKNAPNPCNSETIFENSSYAAGWKGRMPSYRFEEIDSKFNDLMLNS